MELDKQLFESLTASGGMRFDTAGDERRGASRVPVSLRGTLIPMIDGAAARPLQVKLREMSLTGLSLMVTGDAPAIGMFVLILPLRKGAQVRLLYEAVRQQEQQGATVIGARLLRQLESADPIAPTARQVVQAPSGRTVGSVVVPRPQAAKPAPTPQPPATPSRSQAAIDEASEMERIRQAMLS